MDHLVTLNSPVINEENAFTLSGAGSTLSVQTEQRITGSGRLSIIFLIINAALGAGLLNFPQAFDQAGGIISAVTCQLVLLIWIIAALIILVHCSNISNARTLQDVMEGVLGRTGVVICCFVVALYCFGTCITFCVIIGDQFDRVLATLYGNEFCNSWYMNRSFTISVSCTVIILPLCFSKRIDSLRYMSSVGVVAVIYVVLLIVYMKFNSNIQPGPIKTHPDSWTDIFNVVPVICFGYQCHVSVIPIYSCAKKRTLPNFILCAITAITLCFILYTITGIFGYLTLGSNVTSDILEAYAGENPMVLIGIVAIAIKTFTTYPILLFCGREALSKLYTLAITRPGDLEGRESNIRRVIIAFVWFVLTLILAILAPDIGIVIDLLGSLAAVFIFVFPGICLLEMTLHKDPYIILNKGKLYVIAAALCLILGMFVFGVTTTQSIIKIVNQTEKPNRLCINY